MEADTLRLDAFEFLRVLSRGEEGAREAFGGKEVTVDGDIDLRKHPWRKVVEVIPKCTIFGNLYADKDCALRICRCMVSGEAVLDDSLVEEFSAEASGEVGLFAVPVTGKFSAQRCRNLKGLSGRFGSDVDLSKSGIQKLDERFSCIGTLTVAGCQSIKVLDCIAWTINADGSSLRETGPNTKAERFLAEGCPNFRVATAIQDLQYAKFDGSGIMAVSRNFRCGAGATFHRCRSLLTLSGEMWTVEVSLAPLERVDGLRCSEALFFDCEQLPETFHQFQADQISFVRCGFTQIPKGVPDEAELTVAKCRNFSRLASHWKGGMKLRELPQLTDIPEGFSCGGSLEIQSCEGLNQISGVVGGDFDMLSGSGRIEQLGEELEVCGNLYICSNTNVLKLDCLVGGNLKCAEGSPIRETGWRLRVGRNADFSGCREIIALRGDFGRNVVLDGSFVRTLGADFECGGDLSLKNTRQLSFLNCHVGGSVFLEDSALDKTGAAFHCGKDFCISGKQPLSSLAGVVEGCVKVQHGDETVTYAGGGGDLSKIENDILHQLRTNETSKTGLLLRPQEKTRLDKTGQRREKTRV